MPPAFALGFLAAALTAIADSSLPTTPGTEWRYIFNRDGEPSATLTRKIISTDASSLELESSIDGQRESLTKLPTSEFSSGVSGESFHGKIADLDVAVAQSDVGEEDIEVAAGKFRARRFHGEQSGGRHTVVDRWFVNGVGWIKEIATQRSPTGQLLARNSLELISIPATSASAPSTPATLEASVSTSTAGDALPVISDNALQIVARWRVQNGNPPAHVRAVWIAEDTGDVAPSNYKVDEATTELATREGTGTFTLSRPPDGWAAGRYRVEFYLENQLVQKIALTIASARPVAAKR